MVKRHILFDLDGTLIDPKKGVTGSFIHALQALGMPAPSADELHWVIGPPLRDSFSDVLGEEGRHRVPEAIRLYRERYAQVGMHEHQLYPGIREMLQRLHDQSRTLWVATSKPEIFARQIIESLGLKPFFQNVHGSQLDGIRGDKGELIAFILQSEGLDARDCVMVGDRKYDAIGAAKNGMPSIGAGWGYGTSEELLAAGAATVCEKPGDVAAFLEVPEPARV